MPINIALVDFEYANRLVVDECGGQRSCNRAIENVWPNLIVQACLICLPKREIFHHCLSLVVGAERSRGSLCGQVLRTIYS